MSWINLRGTNAGVSTPHWMRKGGRESERERGRGLTTQSFDEVLRTSYDISERPGLQLFDFVINIYHHARAIIIISSPRDRFQI
jgi:hypothetical protein